MGSGGEIFHVILQSDLGVKLYKCWLDMLLVYFLSSFSSAEQS